jgi:Uma2 family endonuclease
VPILVVEVLSPSSRRRDFGPKRELYLDTGIAEYWIVDLTARCIHVITPDAERVVTDEMEWTPTGATTPLRFSVPTLFA